MAGITIGVIALSALCHSSAMTYLHSCCCLLPIFCTGCDGWHHDRRYHAVTFLSLLCSDLFVLHSLPAVGLLRRM